MRLSARLWLSAVVVVVALIAYCALLVDALATARAAESLRIATRETIATANLILSELKDVETGDRGFLLTGQERYLEPYISGRALLPGLQRDLQRFASSADPQVQARIADLDALTARKLDDATRIIADRRSPAWNLRREIVLLDRGKQDMDAARTAVKSIVARSRARLAAIDEDLERGRTRLLILAFTGSFLVALVVLALTALALRAFGQHRARLQLALEAMGSTGTPQDLTSLSAGDFAEVAEAFNDMTVRLSSAAARRDEADRKLNEKNAVLNLVRRMADRLPACADEAEFANVIQSFAPRLTDDRSGALYFLNNSRNLLLLGPRWSGPISSIEHFPPADCWALRRGAEHVSGPGYAEVACAHFVADPQRTHWCVPLIAQSEIVGLLYLEGEPPREVDTVHVLSETVALALVNLRLREKLRSQSVRDPLTGLYNRRYLDESLDLELARAVRSKAPLSAIMLDVDHFKNFNDTFGHDAGDHVLKSVAEVLATSMRRGDVAGRFGGEEFLLIMPGIDLERALLRADAMREAIGMLDLSQNGQKLGRVTASFGIALFPADGETSQTLLHAADKALYAAKDAGRNRVVALR